MSDKLDETTHGDPSDPRSDGRVSIQSGSAARSGARSVPTGRAFSRMDAYSPFPVEGLAEALGVHDPRVPLNRSDWAASLGCLGGFFLQYWVAVIDYPINVGGRPLNSWPAFIPVTFEMTILVRGVGGGFLAC